MEENLKLGSSVTVVDPCYIHGAEAGSMAIEIPITPGFWEPYIEMADSRVSRLGITKRGFRNNFPRFVGEAGVDSGQMMIIDTDAVSNWEDNDKDEWPFGTGADPENPTIENELSYYGACTKTLGPEQSGILENLAVVSSTGYGDGSYPVFVYEDTDGQVERIEVNFLVEDDDDSWEDDLEDDW